ncbi:MAG: DUF819 family protein [Woeseia sp.]|jgi:uncharacterized membrane protein|nr:DUF819 family protein [Woeseia sp.]MBT6208609.1 DUF819 family protein [Woeseia sp.]
MSETLIGSPGGVLAVLCAICIFWFYVEHVTERTLFNYVPPLLFLYATPIILDNTSVIPASSVVYFELSNYALPAFIVLMSLKAIVPTAVKVRAKVC